jgi:hypothetical protein
VQAVLSGMRVLLADNKDLRRFQLPEECYVADADEMARKLSAIDFKNQKMYRPQKTLRDRVRVERSIERISEIWLKLILED